MESEALFFDICRGKSEQIIDSKIFFVKHPNQYEFFLIRKTYESAFDGAKKDGILTEADQVAMVCQQGWWSKEKENRINYLRESVKRLKLTKSNLIYDSDRKRLDDQVEQHLAEISDIQEQRKMYINVTAEDVASQQVSMFFVKRFLYTDEALLTPAFTSESYEYADEFDVICANAAYFQYIASFSTEAIKSLACSMFFQNFLFAVDCSARGIFGLSGAELTKNQLDLVIWGKYFNTIIKNSTSPIPDELYGQPDKLTEWINSKNKQEANEHKRRQNNPASGRGSQSSFVFGSREEIKSLYGEIGGDRVIAETHKKGGLDVFDLAK